MPSNMFGEYDLDALLRFINAPGRHESPSDEDIAAARAALADHLLNRVDIGSAVGLRQKRRTPKIKRSELTISHLLRVLARKHAAGAMSGKAFRDEFNDMIPEFVSDGSIDDKTVRNVRKQAVALALEDVQFLQALQSLATPKNGK